MSGKPHTIKPLTSIPRIYGFKADPRSGNQSCHCSVPAPKHNQEGGQGSRPSLLAPPGPNLLSPSGSRSPAEIPAGWVPHPPLVVPAPRSPPLPALPQVALRLRGPVSLTVMHLRTDERFPRSNRARLTGSRRGQGRSQPTGAPDPGGVGRDPRKGRRQGRNRGRF